MSDLEKYIVEMRDQMNSDEPDPGHLKRFKARIENSKSRSRRINVRHALQIAASVAVILASGIVIVKSSKGSNKVALTPVLNEFQETSTFYATQVNDRYKDISSFDFASAEEKQMLLDELSEMDSYYQELLKEFDANPGDEQVMNALIHHYQLKIEVMDQIIQQLNQLKTNNTNEYEKTSI
jgi:hypothetical protein